MNMTATLNGSATVIALGSELAIKSTILLLIGLVASRILARWKASLGAAVGNACLIGLVVLPLTASMLPGFTLACLPAATSDASPGDNSLDAPDPVPASTVNPVGVNLADPPVPVATAVALTISPKTLTSSAASVSSTAARRVIGAASRGFG